MKWFEYIIIVFAVAIVVLPIIISIRNKKKGKTTGCGHSCSGCPHSCPSKIVDNTKQEDNVDK